FEGGKVDFAADVYAFAVVAFELVTGLNHPLVAPRSLVAGLDPAWDKTLLRCFARDPKLRPASVEQVVAMLELRTRPWKQLGLAVAALAASAMLAVAIWAGWNSLPSGAKGAEQITFDDGFTADPAASADGNL